MQTGPKDKLLIVDDIIINRLILCDMFSSSFDVIEAENGAQALEELERYGEEIAALLLDVVMPVMDGFEVLRVMNRKGWIKNIPVVLITGEDDDDSMLTAYGLGISDMVKKPFNPEIVIRRVMNVVELYRNHREMESKLRQQREELEGQSRRLRESNMFLIDALSTTVEFRNSESGEHIKRIRALTRIILENMRDEYPLSHEEILNISNASALHDIGKIAIPDAVLLKPGRLTREEFEVMKTHTLRGCEILESLNYVQDPEFYNYCYEICRHHHERWDGSGYPDGLKGDEISIWAQAAAVADVYDALTSKRVYKDAYTHEEATSMIINGECGMFNPKMIRCFVQVKDNLLEEIQRLTKEERTQ